MEEREISGKIKVMFYTGNKNKFREVREILWEYGVGIEMRTGKPAEVQSEDITYIVKTCVEVLRKRNRGPGFVEDTGLFIESLNGFPGPYASYVYEKIGLEGVLKLLRGVKNRRAMFRTIIGYWDNKTKLKIFKGEIKGLISKKVRGKGWGYDPVFIPLGFDKTYGEMKLAEKNMVSHRSKAVRLFAEWLVKKKQGN